MPLWIKLRFVRLFGQRLSPPAKKPRKTQNKNHEVQKDGHVDLDLREEEGLMMSALRALHHCPSTDSCVGLIQKRIQSCSPYLVKKAFRKQFSIPRLLKTRNVKSMKIQSSQRSIFMTPSVFTQSTSGMLLNFSQCNLQHPLTLSQLGQNMKPVVMGVTLFLGML